MIWLFERGNDLVRLETRFERTTKEYTLVISWADGRTETERFQKFADYHGRIMGLERELDSDHWIQSGRPTLIPGDWGGP